MGQNQLLCDFLGVSAALLALLSQADAQCRESNLGNAQRKLLGLPLDHGPVQVPSRHRLTQPSAAKPAAQPAKSPLGAPNVRDTPPRLHCAWSCSRTACMLIAFPSPLHSLHADCISFNGTVTTNCVCLHVSAVDIEVRTAEKRPTYQLTLTSHDASRLPGSS